LAGAWTIAGLGLFAAAAVVAVAVGTAVHPDWRNFSPALALGSIVVALPVTFVAHEAIHGLVFRAFGGRPRFGAGFTYGMPYFYAACPGQWFVRDRFLLVGIAPLIVLDAVALLLMLPAATAFFGASMLALNTSGAVGDLWAVAVILQAPRWVEIEDTGPTFIAWAPAQHAPEAAALRTPRGLDAPSARWVMVWFVIMLAVNIVGAGVLGTITRAAGGEVWLGPLFLASRHQLNVLGALLVSAAIAAGITLLVVAASRWLRGSRTRD
jgi:putative zincin peptidase